jgi:hypothetical protein
MWPDKIVILQPIVEEVGSPLQNELLLTNEYGRTKEMELIQQIFQSINKDTIVSIKGIQLSNYRKVVEECNTPSTVVVNLCDG